MALNALRQGAKSGIVKFILMGFMALAVLGLVLMDMGGFFRGGVPTNTIANIDGQEISGTQFQEIVRRNLARQGIDAQTAYQLGFIQQILDSEINTNLLNREAYELGIWPGEDLIAQNISTIIDSVATGPLSRSEAFRNILMNQGMSEAQFVNSIRMEIANTTLRNAVQLSTGYMPEEEARLLYKFQKEKRTVKAVFLPNNTVKNYDEPTDAVLMPFYQAGQERYAIPETRQFTVAVLSMDSLKDSIDVSDEELRQIYEEDIMSYQKPEQRKMSQAVLSTEAEALSVAEAIDENEKSLENAVKTVTGSTEAFLGSDNFEQNGLTEDIALAAFEAQPGDVIGPVETPLGWHVLILEEILPPATEPFAKIKDKLKKGIMHDRSAEQMYLTAGAIDDSLAAGETLEATAKTFDMSLKTYGPVRVDGSTPDDKEGFEDFEDDRSLILETVFEYLEGETSPVIELSDGRQAVIKVDTVNAKTYKPFESVRDSLAKLWIMDQQQVLNKRRIQEVLSSLLNGEKSLEDIAEEHQSEVQTLTLDRTAEVPAPLTQEAGNKLFTLPLNAAVSTNAEDGFVVGYVTEITRPADDQIKAEDLEKIRTLASRNIQGEYLATLLASLRTKYNVKVNDYLLETMYGAGSETVY